MTDELKPNSRQRYSEEWQDLDRKALTGDRMSIVRSISALRQFRELCYDYDAGRGDGLARQEVRKRLERIERMVLQVRNGTDGKV